MGATSLSNYWSFDWKSNKKDLFKDTFTDFVKICEIHPVSHDIKATMKFAFRKEILKTFRSILKCIRVQIC